jgi:hypothetical protein
MPTVHYILRETLRKHGIGHIPWELMNKKQKVTTTNASDAANVKAEVVDGTIRVKAAGTAAAKRSEEQQPPLYKSNGMDNINNDAEDNTSNISSSKLTYVQPVQQSCYSKEVIIQQMDNLQEDDALSLQYQN